MKMVFHYAPWATLPDIVASACLLPSNAGAPNEVPLLWFSKHQSWEPTATKMMQTASGIYQLTFQEQVTRFGCIRFGLPGADPRLMPWHIACKTAGIGEVTRRKLERVGVKRGGNPANWLAVVDHVPIAELALQVFANEVWRSAIPEEMAQAWIERRAGQLAA